MHYSATFHGDTAAMAAACKTLELIDSQKAQQHVHTLGERLISGLSALAHTHGLPAEAFGEPLPPMPFFRFIHESPQVNARLTATFYGEMLARGVLMHPRHMWFISLAHTKDDIDQTLAAADYALGRASQELR